MLFTAILAAIVLKEKITIQKILGVIIMLTGIYVVTSEGFTTGFQFQRGDLLLLLASLVWAVGSIIYKKYITHIPMELVLIIRFMTGSIVFGLVLFVVQSQSSIFVGEFELKHFWYLLAYSIVSVILCRYFFFKSVQISPLFVWSSLALIFTRFGNWI